MSGRETSREDAVLDIATLAGASASDLRALWEARRGYRPPPTFSARLMRLALAWDIQAKAGAGEAATVRRQWQAVMSCRAGGADAEVAVSGLSAPPASAGTRLLKSWGGEMHEVVVREDGVLWNGRVYASLSAVARAMTGTPRNGPKFFGLREGAP
jgi:hypothetical protein